MRRKLEEKSKKYQHLPVYDKEEEKRKTQDRQEKMTKILSDVDKKLGAVSSLTSDHMQEKGIKLKSTPFDEQIHRYNSEDQIQGDNDNPHITLPPYKRKPSDTYQSLGQTFKDLGDKMQAVTSDLQGNNEIPFVDDDDGDDQDIRVSAGRKLIFGFFHFLVSLFLITFQTLTHLFLLFFSKLIKNKFSSDQARSSSEDSKT